MTKFTDQVLVVGGGISGLVTALAAARAGRRVTLVERAPHLGGLLASVAPGDGARAFDLGTHIPAETGDAALDEILFGWMDPAEWSRLHAQRAGTFWNGQLASHTPFLDLRTLPDAAHQAVLPGLLASTIVDPAACVSLAEQITGTYGAAMLEYVFEPVLRKLYGTTAAALAPNAHLLFGLARFLCGSPEDTVLRKRDPAVDAKLAYHPGHVPPGIPSATSWYPTRGGVGAWVDGLHKQCLSAGVEVRTGAAIGTLDLVAGRVTVDDADVAFDEVAWCLPAALLLRQCAHPAAATMTPPSMSAITLHHLVIDRRPTTDAHYITCHDPSVRAFRVTLYDNLQPDSDAPGRITVEVLDPDPLTPAPSAAEVLAELTRMRIISADSGLVAAFEDRIPAAFPIQTLAYRTATRRAVDVVHADCPRVRLVGRAAGQVFFMRDVLLDAWYGKQPATLAHAA